MKEIRFDEVSTQIAQDTFLKIILQRSKIEREENVRIYRIPKMYNL